MFMVQMAVQRHAACSSLYRLHDNNKYQVPTQLSQDIHGLQDPSMLQRDEQGIGPVQIQALTPVDKDARLSGWCLPLYLNY